jgi:hypothetical protein
MIRRVSLLAALAVAPAAANGASLKSAWPLKVYQVMPAGQDDVLLGQTGAVDGPGVAIPDGVTWYVQPYGTTLLDEDVGELAAELKSKNVPGVSFAGFRNIGDDQLRHLEGISLKTIYVGSTSVSDSGLEILASLPGITTLNVSRCNNVSDAGMKHIAAMGSLQRLTLDGLKITDAALDPLTKLSSLTSLSLASTPVTDAGLATPRSPTRDWRASPASSSPLSRCRR